MVAGEVMLFACMIAETGTPWRCAMLSMLSPGATVTAVPPSQLQFDAAGFGGGAATDPVTSGVAGAAGRGGLTGAEPYDVGLYDAMPRPPRAMPALLAPTEDCAGRACEACGGSGWLSTRPTGAACPGGSD